MSHFRVGVSRVDITPPPGTQVAGSVGTKRFAESVLDPLYVRAIVFELGSKRLCLAIIDATILTLPITQQVRAAAAQMGFDPDAVMVQATQTHTAPGLGHFMVDQDFHGIPPELDFIRGADAAYDAAVVPKIVQAIREALAAVKPVKLGHGSGYEGRLAFNRRGVMKDGKVCMPWHSTYQPLGPTFVKYSEGPMDPEVGVLAMRGEDEKMHSVLVHYTCHPVCVYPRPVVSADWCGALCDEVERDFGPQSFAGVINGACGDVNPWPFFDPSFTPDHLRMGRGLADVTKKVVESLQFTEPTVLEHRVKHIKIPVRQVEPEKLKEAEDYIRQHPIPDWVDDKKTQVDWKWMKLVSTLSVELMRRREPLFDYEIQVFRIGDAAIVALPGEPFAIGGLRVKMASPAATTIIAHMTTQYVGYLPTKEAVPRGGHEAETTYWVKLVPEALDMVVEAASALVKEMW